MRTEGKISKVAICPKCHSFVLACHIDFLDRKVEKEFTVFYNEGYIIQLETIEETRSRNLGDYKVCENRECEPSFKST